MRPGPLASAAQPVTAWPRRGTIVTEEAEREPSLTVLWLWLLFSAEMLAFGLLRLPLALSFDSYAFADRGTFPTVCYLVTHGSRPAIDFGYLYGLLPILMTQGVFHLFRWAPVAQEAAMGICGLVSTWGLARFTATMRVRGIGIVLMLVALPFTILASYPTFVHAMEAALLCNALAEQAAGRRPVALALASAACLTKPSMGYVYGFVLLSLIVLDACRGGGNSRSGFRSVLRAVVPSALLGALLVLVLAFTYGSGPLLRTVVPGSASLSYRHMGYGSVFYGGRNLWYRQQQALPFYLFTVSGFWIAATLWIIVAGTWAGSRVLLSFWNRSLPARSYELAASCAALHLAFITTFFGGPISWEYYSYVLVLGAACTSVWEGRTRRVVSILAVLALSGQTGHVAMAAKGWRTTARVSNASRLWISEEEDKAWRQVLGAIRGQDAFALTSVGEVAVLFPQFRPPVGAFLTPGVATEVELSQTMDAIRTAPATFAVTSGSLGYALDFFPHLRSELETHEVILEVIRPGGNFTVYGRPPVERGRAAERQ